MGFETNENHKPSKMWECVLSKGAKHTHFSPNKPPKITYTGQTIFHPAEDAEPNWFHRLMHRLVFGFRWRKK